MKNQRGSDNLRFEDAGSLASSGDVVETTSKAYGVILCKCEWKETMTELENALNVLAMAHARIIGIAVLGQGDLTIKTNDR